jgi:PRC-barrel domain
MDRSTQTPLSAEELNESNLAGATIYGTEYERVGSISHLHSFGSTTQAVVDVGGFLGIGSKPVLIGLAELNMMRDANGTVFGTTSWTKDQMKALPEHRD